MSPLIDPHAQFKAAWRKTAQALGSLPAKERAALKETLRHFNHDMGDRAGLVRSAEVLLRRQTASSCDLELLDIIRQAAQDLLDLIQVLREFTQSIADE